MLRRQSKCGRAFVSVSQLPICYLGALKASLPARRLHLKLRTNGSHAPTSRLNGRDPGFRRKIRVHDFFIVRMV
jgi:hypothetical protein